MSSQSTKNFDSYLKVADNLHKFNQEYKSTTLDTAEIYMYISLLRKFDWLKEHSEIEKYKSELRKRNVLKKLLKSPRLKDKIFGLVNARKIM